jgi:hypothetical protein
MLQKNGYNPHEIFSCMKAPWSHPLAYQHHPGPPARTHTLSLARPHTHSQPNVAVISSVEAVSPTKSSTLITVRALTPMHVQLAPQ